MNEKCRIHVDSLISTSAPFSLISTYAYMTAGEVMSIWKEEVLETQLTFWSVFLRKQNCYKIIKSIKIKKFTKYKITYLWYFMEIEIFRVVVIMARDNYKTIRGN